MKQPTIFDGTEARWSERSYDLTPIHQGRVSYKREDLFAPLGYGSINGTKLRQLIYLVDDAAAHGATGVLTGASVLSPQVSMTALVAKHYRLPCVIVLGGTKAETAIKHPNVALAAAADAGFVFAPVGYNPALQRAVANLAAEREMAGWYRLAYGISTPAEADTAAILKFHLVGAHQAKSIGSKTERLVMTAGSCNSCTSVLLGIAQHRPPALREINLIGVGPTKLAWMYDRLVRMGDLLGLDVAGLYRPDYPDHPLLQEAQRPGPGGDIVVRYDDLHARKYCTYQDRMPWTADGIDFHPTYEGKAMRWLDGQAWWQAAGPETLFWIVGSAPA